MKKNKLYKVLPFFMLVAILFAGCETYNDDLSTTHEGTNMENMAGEWFVKIYRNGVQKTNYKRILTYNTSANQDNKMFVDDRNSYYGCKGVVDVNYSALTFSGTNIDESYYGVTMNITNGKVLMGVGRSTSGNVTDSIYFEVEFSDDPGAIYIHEGHRRTGFLEDEH